jgi:hypothetical protein
MSEQEPSKTVQIKSIPIKTIATGRDRSAPALEICPWRAGATAKSAERLFSILPRKERRPKLGVTRQAGRSISRRSESIATKVKLSDCLVDSCQTKRQAQSQGIVNSE